MKCYFCQQDTPPYGDCDFLCKCLSCAAQFNTGSIFTAYKDGAYFIAHIYLQKKKMFHIRLWIAQNVTTICVDDQNQVFGEKEIMRLDGLLINPQNIKSKLGAILTFL